MDQKRREEAVEWLRAQVGAAGNLDQAALLFEIVADLWRSGELLAENAILRNGATGSWPAIYVSASNRATELQGEVDRYRAGAASYEMDLERLHHQCGAAQDRAGAAESQLAEFRGDLFRERADREAEQKVFRAEMERSAQSEKEVSAAVLAERSRCAQVARCHTSSLARLGGDLFEDDVRLLRQRGVEIAQEILGTGGGVVDYYFQNERDALRLDVVALRGEKAALEDRLENQVRSCAEVAKKLEVEAALRRAADGRVAVSAAELETARRSQRDLWWQGENLRGDRKRLMDEVSRLERDLGAAKKTIAELETARREDHIRMRDLQEQDADLRTNRTSLDADLRICREELAREMNKVWNLRCDARQSRQQSKLAREHEAETAKELRRLLAGVRGALVEIALEWRKSFPLDYRYDNNDIGLVKRDRDALRQLLHWIDGRVAAAIVQSPEERQPCCNNLAPGHRHWCTHYGPWSDQRRANQRARIFGEIVYSKVIPGTAESGLNDPDHGFCRKAPTIDWSKVGHEPRRCPRWVAAVPGLSNPRCDAILDADGNCPERGSHA